MFPERQSGGVVTVVAELGIAASVGAWQKFGLAVAADSTARVGSVLLHFETPTPAHEGVVGWCLAGAPTTLTDIDGLPTTHVVEPARPPDGAPAGNSLGNPLGILGFDHLVVMTSSLERTCGAIEEATGEPLKRVREIGAIRQGFHRLGEVIVEVVESPQITSATASFWGFVWNVVDLHGVCERLGPEVIGLPRAAVQPGRFIATVRNDLGLGLPLALMTPP